MDKVVLILRRPWKQVNSFKDYFTPPGKPKARTSLKDHLFFYARKALKVTQASDDGPSDDPIILSDDEEMVDVSDESVLAGTADSSKAVTHNVPAVKKKFGFARQLYLQKEKVKLNPQSQPKRRGGIKLAKFARS